MSGGSMDYVYFRVEEAAEKVSESTALRAQFKAHLALVARALHDIEWVDSADYGPGAEDEAIRACLFAPRVSYGKCGTPAHMTADGECHEEH